jgi:hypothetical protein
MTTGALEMVYQDGKEGVNMDWQVMITGWMEHWLFPCVLRTISTLEVTIYSTTHPFNSSKQRMGDGFPIPMVVCSFL